MRSEEMKNYEKERSRNIIFMILFGLIATIIISFMNVKLAVFPGCYTFLMLVAWLYTSSDEETGMYNIEFHDKAFSNKPKMRIIK
jgi:hypothetical protein